jgi:hypothetical protein
MTGRAFTLLELMIAVALGMLIVYVAVAGFRVATQSITITNRMALENDLLRAAVLTANERLDFWTDYDDPENAAEQRLRGRDGDGGLPFTPMSRVFPLVRNADPEKSTGWDPQDPWKASDPRTWWQGNVAEKWKSEMLLGRYSVFGNTQPPVLVTGVATGVVLNGAQGIGTYGTVTVPHEWQYRQIWGMYGAIGYFGFTDYLPQNTLFACYTEFHVPTPPMWSIRETNQDGMPLVLFRPGSAFDNGEGDQQYPKGLWRLTMASSYGVVSPTNANANQSAAHRTRWTTGYWNDQNGMRNFLNQTENRRALMQGPAHWPATEVTTQHFIKTGRYVNLGRVRMNDPITGATTEIVFTSFATTLRGARLQRRHPQDGGGWADHDNRMGFIAPLTLDDTP